MFHYLFCNINLCSIIFINFGGGFYKTYFERVLPSDSSQNNLFHPHIPSQPTVRLFLFHFYLSSLSLACVALLVLAVGLALGLLYLGNIITERWLSISQRLSNANRSTTSDAIYCLPSPLHAKLFFCQPGFHGSLGHAVTTTTGKSHVKLLYCVLETVFLGVTNHCWLLEAFCVLFHKDPWAFGRPVWYEYLM